MFKTEVRLYTMFLYFFSYKVLTKWILYVIMIIVKKVMSENRSKQLSYQIIHYCLTRPTKQSSLSVAAGREFVLEL